MITYPDSMNGYSKYSRLFFLILYGMCSCDPPANHEKSGFGKMISTICVYSSEIDALEKKADECVDFARAYKYAIMARNRQKEGNEELQQIFEAMPKPVLIPVEQASYTHLYALSELEITTVDLSAFSLQAKVSLVKQSTSQPIEVHLCGIDESGAEIVPALCLKRINDGHNHNELVLKGQLDHPENFAGLVQFKVVDDKSFTK